MDTFWTAVGSCVGLAALLIALLRPSLNRIVGRRKSRRGDDVMWNGQAADLDHGIQELSPMWVRMSGVEKRLTALELVEERSRELEPDGNGGHSLYDLIRKLAVKNGIDVGEPKESKIEPSEAK
jgi:hypothetical protein